MTDPTDIETTRDAFIGSAYFGLILVILIGTLIALNAPNAALGLCIGVGFACTLWLCLMWYQSRQPMTLRAKWDRLWGRPAFRVVMRGSRFGGDRLNYAACVYIVSANGEGEIIHDPL